MDQTGVAVVNPDVRQSDSLLVLPSAGASGRGLKCLWVYLYGFSSACAVRAFTTGAYRFHRIEHLSVARKTPSSPK